jgi:uncharacterized protein (TIGR02246 family)
MRPALLVMVLTAAVVTPALAGGPAIEMDPLAALARMVRAVNTGDAHAYAMLYAPNAAITIHGSGVLQGRAAIEAHEVELLRQYPGARLGFRSIWRKGPTAVVHYTVSGRTTGGQAMGHEGLLFYRFLPSGLIAEERRYLDSLTPMAQLGALGPAPARAIPDVPDKPVTSSAAPDASERRETDDVTRVKAMLAALDARDEAAFLAGLADEVVLDEMTEPQPLAGKQAVKAWLQSRASAVADGKSEITTILGVGDAVLVEWVARGTLNGRVGRVSASGTPFTVHRAAIVELREAKVVRCTVFANGKELAEAVGQWPLPAGR